MYSRLYGNYTGLANSDEILTPPTGTAQSVAQQQATSIARPGGNTNRVWDLDEVLWDAHGHLNVLGRLPTDRPHVVKIYGSYVFRFGTQIGGLFYGGSGTPLTTAVNTSNQVKVFVNGRGDMDRTPFLSQTDIVLAHEVKLHESKTLRFEFTAGNVFNQQTPRHRFTNLNRGDGLPRTSSAINLRNTDLSSGYDHRALIEASPDGQGAYDPRYGLADLFNPGFTSRIGVRFTF